MSECVNEPESSKRWLWQTHHKDICMDENTDLWFL